MHILFVNYALTNLFDVGTYLAWKKCVKVSSQPSNTALSNLICMFIDYDSMQTKILLNFIKEERKFINYISISSIEQIFDVLTSVKFTAFGAIDIILVTKVQNFT